MLGRNERKEGEEGDRGGWTLQPGLGGKGSRCGVWPGIRSLGQDQEGIIRF